MKRTVPLIITALGGFVLIVAFFIPYTEGWGDVAAIWFDVLAAIAFVLGGGNLLKMNLKKISDHRPGWGYAAVTLVAFLFTLTVGLGKIGVLVALESSVKADELAAIGRQVAMHIASANPIAIDAAGVDPAVVKREKDASWTPIAAESPKPSPPPAPKK